MEGARTPHRAGGQRRSLAALVVFFVVASVTLVSASVAGAADTVVNPGTSKATATGGHLKVNTKLDLDIGTMSPAPRIDNLSVAADGTLSAPASGFNFPTQVMTVDTPIGDLDVSINIRAQSPITGSIDPTTGEFHLNTSLTIQLTGSRSIINLGNNCYVGTPSNPIPFSASALPDDSRGTHYDEYTGAVSLVDDTIAIPAASGCPTVVGNNVNDVVNGELGLPSASGQNQVQFEFRLNPAPHSENWEDPNGPGNVEPTIVNDESIEAGGVGTFRSWLESRTISDGATSGRNGNTVRVSMLVRHNPGLKVTDLRITDWSGSSVRPVTSVQPEVAGGFNYSRVTYEYVASRDGMDISCPGLIGGDGDRWVKRSLSVSAILEKPDQTTVESEPSESDIAITREHCANKPNVPMIFGWNQDKTEVTPGEPVTFKFKGDDLNADVSIHWNNFGGVNWRWRNLDTGFTGNTELYCPGGNQDNKEQSLTFNKPDSPMGRGRWVLEASLTNEQDGCGRIELPGLFFWVGAVDVNSPQTGGALDSPRIISLDVPYRPASDGALPISVNAEDSLDLGAGGKVQSIEWDLDGDETNGVDGYETVRLGDSRTGMGPGQSQMLLETADQSPGIYPVRVRVSDNGSLGAADGLRRTSPPAIKTYMVNTPPTADGLTVTTDFNQPVATPVTAADTNADGSHDQLRYRLETGPAHGFLAGEWPDRTYHPESGFSGSDSFTYRVDDGFGGSATATVSITVKAKPADPDPDPDPGPDQQKRDHLEASFPEGRMNLNEAAGPSTSGVKVVDSAIKDAPVTFKTDYWNRTTGEINAPASDFVFPSKSVQMSVTQPIPLDLDVKIEFGALGNVTGSYNQSSGAMKLNMDVHALITVSASNGNLKVMTCDVTPIPMAFSSSGADLVDPGEPGATPPRPAKNWKAEAFSPPARDGAVTSLWNSLPASTAVSEPLAPTATCGGTLDSLIGGKGGFWLGGKVKVAADSGGGDAIEPGDNTGIFDGKRLHIRLKCGSQYKPKCDMLAAPVTRKDKKVVKRGKNGRKIVKVKRGKAMAKPIRKKIKAGKWAKVTFLIKKKFRKKVAAMSKSKKKTLYVQQKVRSKRVGKRKFKGKKPRIVYHRYIVRSAG